MLMVVNHTYFQSTPFEEQNPINVLPMRMSRNHALLVPAYGFSTLAEPVVKRRRKTALVLEVNLRKACFDPASSDSRIITPTSAVDSIACRLNTRAIICPFPASG